MNHALLAILNPAQIEVEIWREDDLAKRRGLSSELDEMWSYVRRKSNPRWLWHAIDHHTGKVLAYVFGRRQDAVFLQLKALLKPFGITRYYTDGWGAYERHVDAEHHRMGKEYTQKIESKHTDYEHGSSGWCAARSAFPKRSACTIWSLGSSSTAMNLVGCSDGRSTHLRHLRLADYAYLDVPPFAARGSPNHLLHLAKRSHGCQRVHIVPPLHDLSALDGHDRDEPVVV